MPPPSVNSRTTVPISLPSQPSRAAVLRWKTCAVPDRTSNFRESCPWKLKEEGYVPCNELIEGNTIDEFLIHLHEHIIDVHKPQVETSGKHAGKFACRAYKENGLVCKQEIISKVKGRLAIHVAKVHFNGIPVEGRSRNLFHG
ncbi:hypothetical protein BD626DRAFT_503965 [Schizophyllum amplum]|uniref:Uncharacterized protein n=1 Tax=Schizophyllum amplum TaxID=97359 RepID=A0A550C2T7_9AGAR|nr:hypothetical protein BD626DRAFT_509160 [Auriculariopsis ampla]TRM60821.1 hypothetical protein BD626DRAFT_503965 [Auriculariopsis ampla]